MTYADGKKYEGDFENGKEHGKGTFTFAEGGKYRGKYEVHSENGKLLEIV
jgi:hypothetical protein